MDRNHAIPCPECQTAIPFDTLQLLNGTSFSCPNCQASISLAAESKPLVQDTLDRLEELKRKMIRKEDTPGE